MERLKALVCTAWIISYGSATKKHMIDKNNDDFVCIGAQNITDFSKNAVHMHMKDYI